MENGIIEKKHVWVSDKIKKMEEREFSAEAQELITGKSAQWHI